MLPAGANITVISLQTDPSHSSTVYYMHVRNKADMAKTWQQTFCFHLGRAQSDLIGPHYCLYTDHTRTWQQIIISTETTTIMLLRTWEWNNGPFMFVCTHTVTDQASTLTSTQICKLNKTSLENTSFSRAAFFTSVNKVSLCINMSAEKLRN